jgi:hypothetical protein
MTFLRISHTFLFFTCSQSHNLLFTYSGFSISDNLSSHHFSTFTHSFIPHKLFFLRLRKKLSLTWTLKFINYVGFLWFYITTMRIREVSNFLQSNFTILHRFTGLPFWGVWLGLQKTINYVDFLWFYITTLRIRDTDVSHLYHLSHLFHIHTSIRVVS